MLKTLNKQELLGVNGGIWQYIAGYLIGEVLNGIQDGIDRYEEEGCPVECPPDC